jgi:PAS domain S-box-containing protein
VLDEGPPAAPDIAPLRDIAQESPAATLVLGGPSHRILYANAAFCEASGRPEQALLGRTAEEAFPHLAADGHVRVLDGVRAGARAHRRAAVPLRLDPGQPERLWDLEAAPLRAAGGAVVGLFLQLRDAGPVGPAQREADAARAALDALFEHIPEGLVLADAPDVRLRRVSAFGLDLVGRSAEEVLGRDAPAHPRDWEVLHLDGATPARPEELPLTRAVRHGETVQHESWMLRRKDGTPLTILCSAGPIRSARDGRITGGILAWRDVTAMRATEEALARSEARYRALVEAGALAVWTTGPDGALRGAEAWSRLTGQTPEEAAGDGWLDALHPEDRERIRRCWEASVAEGAPYEAEYRLRQRGEGWRWTAAAAVPVRDPGTGRVAEWIGVNTDIHARKTAEGALRASQDRFRTLAETMPHLVWQADASGAPEYMNRRMQGFTGLRPACQGAGAAPGWLATVHPEDAPGLAEAWEAALAEGGEFDVDARLRGPDGAWRWFRVQGAPVRDAEGQVRQWVGTCTDVEDRRRAEDANRAALEAQERLARTAEHRIKNSLQMVAALLRLQAGRVAAPAAREALEAAVARVQAVAEAHRALQRSPDMRSVRVADVLEELAAGAGLLHPGADLRFEAEPELMLDAERAIPLALVLSELVTGVLARESAGPVRLLARPAPAGGLEVAVEAAGAGRLEDAGDGGLGATVVRALTRQIGAALAAEEGTRIAVTLPAEPAAAA